ncbi:MAG: LPS assembly protein LptD [Planctomycetes bacterium]|nr:LPS assembly protein LptD [Planctomycetota bacterium]
MKQWRVLWLLILLLAVAGSSLHAQNTTETPTSPGKVEIAYVVEDDAETFWEIRREGTSGPFVLALPFAVRLNYADTTRPKAGGATVTKKLELLADRALIWFEPESADKSKVEGDPFLAMSSGVRNLQFYGEGNVWLRYSIGSDSLTIRADVVYLDFAKSRVVSYTSTGEETFAEELNLRGRLKNVRAHSGAGDDGGDAKAGGLPLKTGIGIGDAADEARDPSRSDGIGAAPSDDAVPQRAGRFKSLPQERGLRLFLRANELRLLKLNPEEQEVELEGGSISSSSLAVASYSLAADFLTIRLTKLRRTAYITRPAIRVLDFPLLRLDVEDYAFDLDSSPFIRQLDLGRSSQYGYWFRTYIDAVATYDFFGDPEPPFRPLQLGPQLDYYTDRGFGSGVNLDWGGMKPFEPFGKASLRSYYIHDRGDDRDRARELGYFPLENQNRGRVLGAYSQGFDGGWQLDNIFSYESDRTFRREFYQREYDNNEPNESYIRLTKRDGPLNFFLLLAPRVHPWQDRTEYLPTLGFDVSRVEVGDFGLQLSSHSEASMLVLRPHKKSDPRPDTYVPRIDSATWFNLPLQVGPFAFDPFVGARVTMANTFLKIPGDAHRPDLGADGTFQGLRPGDERDHGYLYRVMPFFGANLQTFFTRTYPDVKIPWLGIDGLRHVFTPFVRYRNVAWNSLDEAPERAFIPMDPVDTLDEFEEVRVGFRNRLQTRTGTGADRHTTDYFELMLELPLYPHHRRDNRGRFYGDVEISAQWRPAPRFALAGTVFIDPITGNFNRASASFRFDIVEFGQANIYYRLLKGQHQVVGVQLELTLSELYRVSAKQEYDMEAGRFRDTRVELSRRILEAVDLGFVFSRDAVEGDIGFYFSLSAAFRAPKGGSSLLR